MDDLTNIRGHDLAKLAMRGRNDGGMSINGAWAFDTLQRGRNFYTQYSASKGLPEFVSGTVSYDTQVAYFADGTSICTDCGDSYESYLQQAIVLMRLLRSV